VKRVETLIGVSPAIQTLRVEVEHAARCDAKVLLTGESGVGKEVAARMIHANSARATTQLVAINCVGIPETLLESELFGHMRGSFTGAHGNRAGLLEAANGGTVFLDEIGEMSPRMQALLLRFLETGEIQRVGAERPQHRLDVRVIAATNRDPLADIAAGTFREDLYYRLNVIDITIPPLRSRREDIPVLLEHYLRRYSHQHGVPLPTIAPDALRWITNYEWPGNVRELKNAAERLIVRRCGPVVGLANLPAVVRDRRSATAAATLLPCDSIAGAAPAAVAGEPAARSVADTIFDRLVKQRESFWSTVYLPFMVRDLTRSDLRALITRGLEQTYGNYKMLVELFNMERSDYKRFLNFLRKQQCQVPYARFRALRPRERVVSDARLAPSHMTRTPTSSTDPRPWSEPVGPSNHSRTQ
jgi:DNA-binding NtrC family response regulator